MKQRKLYKHKFKDLRQTVTVKCESVIMNLNFQLQTESTMIFY